MGAAAGRRTGADGVSLLGGGVASLPARLAGRIQNERARQTLQRDLERLVDGAAEPPADGMRIGIATLDSGAWHLAIELLLAHALRLRGARTQLLVCDLPTLPICDERTIHSRSIDRCAGCVDDKASLLTAARLPWRGVSQYVDAGARQQAQRVVAGLRDEELTRYQEGRWPIGEWLHVSASHFLRRDAAGADAEIFDTRRRLLVAAIVVTQAVDRWLEAVRPDVVIAESGAHLTWRIALELARARGVPVVCREMGKGGWDHHIYALNADSMSPDLGSAWALARRQPLTADEDAAVDAFIRELPARTYTQAPGRHGHATVSIPRGDRVAVAFTNVTWDLATAGRDVAFNGVLDWLAESIDALSGYQGVHLVVRVHPAESSAGTREPLVDRLRARWPGGLPHVTVVGPDETATVRELCARADVTLAYNSTAGLEAAAFGRPVVLCGAPHYRGKGFTIDVSTREEYRERLRAWASGGDVCTPPDAEALARRYCHLFFLRYHLRMGWTTSPLGPPFELTIRSFSELAPGANPVLDVVCAGILNATQIVLPRSLAVTGAP